MSNMKKLLALLLALAMIVAMAAACGEKTPDPSDGPSNGPSNGPGDPSGNPDPENPGEEYVPITGEAGKYTYSTSVSTMPAAWNPHTYQTADDSVPLDYTTDGLYTILFNDQIHPLEGRTPFDGYVIVPSMAADYPVDVTEAVKAAHPEFNIPASATSGYAWSVKLRDDLKWEDGTPITAQDFVDSLERVLRPELLNYRAADYDRGTYAVVNAQNYSQSGVYTYNEFVSAAYGDDEYIDPADFVISADGIVQVVRDGVTADIVLDLTSGGNWSSNTPTQYYNAYKEKMPALAAAFETLQAAADENGKVKLTAETLKALQDFIANLQGYETVEDYAAAAGDYAYIEFEEMAYLGAIWKEAGYSFDNVGLYVSGNNELTFVFANALDGFYLMTYAMSTNYLVKTDMYDSLLKETATASGTVWSSTYGTSKETWVSYGPYMISEFQGDKQMHFVKNPNWWGWGSDTYKYVDPVDGETYEMYQTTDIDIQHISEASTNKQMFLAGQLISYGLQADDFDQYATSERYYVTPAETIYFLLFNGNEDVIAEREAADDFDQSTTDLQCQTLESFRRAFAVSIDRELMADTVSPQREGGYAFLGNTYIYDPETAAYYRSTDQAKMALVEFYSMNLADYNNDLDAAVNAITGYDPVTAKELFAQAYQEALDKGYITDNDGDGKSDQTVTMIYAMSDEVSDFFTKTFKFLNDSLNAAAAGTGFEGKIAIVPSAPVGNQWSDMLRNGTMDTQLAGWSGSTLDPFGMADTWTDSSRSYWGRWFNSNAYSLTITLDGEEITMSARAWALCLNGTMVTVNGKDYNFGYGQTSVENRLTILAEIEKFMLTSYVCAPIMQNGSGSLLSYKVFYVVEDYVPMMSRGGITYMKYNYDDAEWAEWVNSQKGQLQY